MDVTDIALIKLLMTNSQTPYRKLTDKLGLSVNTVYKRIQTLKESGIIRTFIAKIHLLPLKVVSVLVFGRSIADSLFKILSLYRALLIGIINL